MLINSCCSLPTEPIVARQVAKIIRTSPEFKRINTYLPSLPSTCALVPAERINCPPLPGFISMLWITVPTGMFSNGNALPTLISASGPDTRRMPTSNPFGAKMYALTPSS